jgi:1-pyrroline-5-carboxylate dehydrogenase
MTVVMEQFLRMAIHCGMPIGDVDYINCSHKHTEDLVIKGQFRQIQFTGSTEVAEKLCNMTNGKVKIEDAGFDWKILGPDVAEIDYVTYTSD